MLPNSSTQPKAPPKRKPQHTDDSNPATRIPIQESTEDDGNGKYQVYSSSKYPARNKGKAYDYSKSSQKRGRLTTRRVFLDRYDSQKYSDENKKFKYAEQEGKKVEVKFNLPEDTRISKLLRRLSVEEDAENSLLISRKLLEVLLLPDNAAYVKKSFNILRDSILQILYVAPGVQAKKQCARAFGRMGYILAQDSYDFSKYLKVILKPKVIEEETICLYMEALKETLLLDREKQVLDKNSVYYLMNDLINLIENTDNVEIFQAVLNNLINLIEFYPSGFFEFFKDTIDVLFGWHVDHTQPLANIEFISRSLIRISHHFQINLDFSLTLIVNFIEDIETYGNQIIKHTEHVTVFILALNTVLQCLNKSEKNEEVFSVKLISDALTKISTILTKTCNEDLIIAGNKSLCLLLEVLSMKSSTLVELIMRVIDCELAIIHTINNAGIISILFMVSKVIKELSANLPIDLIRKLVGPESQLIELRNSHFVDIQEATICVYQALLNLKNIPLLQEAYRYILSDLEVAFKVINPEIGSLTLSLQEIENISAHVDVNHFNVKNDFLKSDSTTVIAKNDINITSKHVSTNITSKHDLTKPEEKNNSIQITTSCDSPNTTVETCELDVNAQVLKESEMNYLTSKLGVNICDLSESDLTNITEKTDITNSTSRLDIIDKKISNTEDLPESDLTNIITSTTNLTDLSKSEMDFKYTQMSRFLNTNTSLKNLLNINSGNETLKMHTCDEFVEGYDDSTSVCENSPQVCEDSNVNLNNSSTFTVESILNPASKQFDEVICEDVVCDDSVENLNNIGLFSIKSILNPTSNQVEITCEDSSMNENNLPLFADKSILNPNSKRFDEITAKFNALEMRDLSAKYCKVNDTDLGLNVNDNIQINVNPLEELDCSSKLSKGDDIIMKFNKKTRDGKGTNIEDDNSAIQLKTSAQTITNDNLMFKLNNVPQTESSDTYSANEDLTLTLKNALQQKNSPDFNNSTETNNVNTTLKTNVDNSNTDIDNTNATSKSNEILKTNMDNNLLELITTNFSNTNFDINLTSRTNIDNMNNITLKTNNDNTNFDIKATNINSTNFDIDTILKTNIGSNISSKTNITMKLMNYDDLTCKSNQNTREKSTLTENFDKIKALSLYLNQIENLTSQLNPFSSINYDYEEAGIVALFLLRCLSQLANASGSIIGMWALKPSILELLGVLLQPYNKKLERIPGLQFSLIYLLYSHCKCYNFFVSSSDLVRQKTIVRALSFNLAQDVTKSPNSGNFSIILDALYKIFKFSEDPEILLLALKWSNEIFVISEPYLEILYADPKFLRVVRIMIGKCGYVKDKNVILGVGENLKRLLSNKQLSWRNCFLKEINKLCILRMGANQRDIREIFTRLFASISWDVSVLEIGKLYETSLGKEHFDSDSNESDGFDELADIMGGFYESDNGNKNVSEPSDVQIVKNNINEEISIKERQSLKRDESPNDVESTIILKKEEPQTSEDFQIAKESKEKKHSVVLSKAESDDTSKFTETKGILHLSTNAKTQQTKAIAQNLNSNSQMQMSPGVLQRLQRILDLNFDFNNKNATCLFLQALRERNVYKKEDRGRDNSLTIFKAQQLHINGVLYGEILPHHFATFMDYLLKNISPIVEIKENVDEGNITAESTRKKSCSIDSLNFLQTIFVSSWPLESENQELSDEFREICVLSQEVLNNWITWEAAQYCVNNKLRTTLGKPNETLTSFENCLKKLAKEIMIKHQNLTNKSQEHVVGNSETYLKTKQEDIGNSGNDLKAKHNDFGDSVSDAKSKHGSDEFETDLARKSNQEKDMNWEDNRPVRNENLKLQEDSVRAKPTDFDEEVDELTGDETKDGFDEVQIKINKDDHDLDKHCVKILQDEKKIKIQQKPEVKVLQQKDEGKQEIKIMQQKDLNVQKEQKTNTDENVQQNDDKMHKEGKNQQKEKNQSILQKDMDLEEDSCKNIKIVQQQNEEVNIKRVHLLLTFIDNLEKLIQNAAEGSAFSIPQPAKPVRTFFTTNAQTCKDWLSRIRIILIQLSLHAGQNVLALRHAQELIKDFINTNKQDGIDFKRVVMYATLALLNLKESEAIYGLYIFCKSVTKKKFVWIKAASDQALNKFELAAKSYEKILAELNEDVYVRNFVSDQIINCYKELNDWKEIVDYKNGNMNLVFMESENCLRYSFNTVDFACAKALFNYEIDDGTSCQNWQDAKQDSHGVLYISKNVQESHGSLCNSKSLQDIHKDITFDQNYAKKNVDELKLFSRSFSDGPKMSGDFAKLPNLNESICAQNFKTLEEIECSQKFIKSVKEIESSRDFKNIDVSQKLHERNNVENIEEKKNFDLSLFETLTICEFYPAKTPDKFESLLNTQSINELTSWKELELQNSASKKSWSIYDALNITETNLYNIALNMRNPFICAKQEQFSNSSDEELLKLQHLYKLRLLNEIDQSLERIRIFLQDNITHLPSLFLKDFALLNYVANGLKNVIAQKPASVVFLVSEDFENEVNKIDSSSLSKILWWSEYFAKIQNQGFNTFSSNLRLNLIKKARKESNHGLATNQLFKFFKDKNLMCDKSDHNLRKKGIFLVDLAEGFRNKIPEINLWTLDMAKAAQEMIKLLYNEKKEVRVLNKQRHENERKFCASRLEKERKSSFCKDENVGSIYRDEHVGDVYRGEDIGSIYRDDDENIGCIYRDEIVGRSFYTTNSFMKSDGNETYKKLAFDLCAISTTSISKCADIYGGTELKQVSSKILLKLANWLQINNNEVSLTEINTPLGKFLSVLPEIGTDLKAHNFHTNKFNIGDNLIPINEMMIGKLLQFSVNQCQNLAKNWSAFGTWCYRWGKKIVDNSSDLTNTLTEEDKMKIRNVIPQKCSEDEFQRILMILSQTRNHVDDEDIDNSDVKTSEMIRNQLKNMSVLSKRGFAVRKCSASNDYILSGCEEGFWKLQDLKKCQNVQSGNYIPEGFWNLQDLKNCGSENFSSDMYISGNVSSSGSTWSTKPVENVPFLKLDEHLVASIDSSGTLENANLQHLRKTTYDVSSLSDEANLKNWRKFEKTSKSDCQEMSADSSGYASEINKFLDDKNFEKAYLMSTENTSQATSTSSMNIPFMNSNPEFKKSDCDWSEARTSEETIDHLVQIWKNLQKRIYAYYGLSVEAYFKYLHLTSHSANITKATEANTVTVTLRLLRLIVKHALELQNCLEEGLSRTPTQPWKIIIPQLFSRLNHPESFVRERVSELLCRVAEDSPHLITFPAVVGALEGGVKFDFSEISLPKNCLSQKMKDCFIQDNNKNDDDDEEEEEVYESDDDCKDILQACFKSMVETLSKKTPETIKQVKLLVKELRRIILLWDELWLGTLAQHHGEIQKRQQQLELEIEKVNSNKNLNSEEKISLITEKHRIILKPIIFILEQLNEITSVDPETPHERQFQERFTKTINDVLLKLKNPEHPERPQESWKLLKDLQNQFQQKSHKTRNLLKMQEISPILSNITNTLISMPGQTLRRKVYIQKVSSQVSILPTKTKPKKLIFYGSDGKTYTYLFKGLEDLHLDERIMQFLSITNKLLAQNSEGTGHNLYRARHYSVIPLGPRSGLISWVSGTTPVFSLYKRWQQREAQKLNNTQILRPSELFYNKLNPLLQEQGIKNLDNRKEWPLVILKQVLTELMSETPSDLLSKELWLNSINARNYWQVVKKYNYSVAVMSIIGYIIGLGDRHLDNVLVDLSTGEVVHIDYNVCFEKGKTLRVPEKVPFRLTPNIRDALGVTGIEGMFRLACEHILKTMKKGRETLLTLLEAFVYDPLVDWTVGNDGLVGTTFGGISTNTTHKKQTRKDLEKEVTLAMYRVRCTEMKTDWDQNRDDILQAIPNIKNLLKEWLNTHEKSTKIEDLLQDLHQQMALVKEAEANGIYKDSLHTLPSRYENFRQQQEKMKTAKKDLEVLLKDSEVHLEKFSESIKYLQNQQIQTFFAELNKNNDKEKVFELVKEFLQNAGQVGMIQQCDASENEVASVQEQQNLAALKCLNLLQEYWMVYSQCPQSYLENHRLFHYVKWLNILKNSTEFQTCENILQQFYTFANLQSITKQAASCVLKFSYMLNILYNQALAQAQKAYEELTKMRQDEPVLILEKRYADAKTCLTNYLAHEKNGAKALEFVILSELLVLNRTFLTLETAASKSGDWLIKLTSREGDWFLDELTLNSSKAIELIGYLSIVDDVKLMKVVDGLNAANNVYKALHELNFNFHTIILPESMKKIQSEEGSVVDMVRDLRGVILGLGMPLQDLVIQLEKELTCVVMEMDHSPTYDIIQTKLTTLKQQYQVLLQHTSTSEILTPGKMLLMGFNGLFEKLNLESNNIINTLGQIQIPQCWRKLDQVKDAKSLTTPIFNQEVKKIIEDIFLLKRINAMHEFFTMCTEMCKSFQKGQDYTLFMQNSESKLENAQLSLQENVVIFNDEQLIKPIRKYIADFISKQFLGVTTEAIAYVICFLLQRLGLSVTKEIEQKDIGAENKVPLEELYHKGWNLFVKNGLFNQNTLAETSTIQSNVKSAWEKIQKPKMLEKTLALMQSSVQRLQHQLSAHFWIHEDLLTQKNNFLRSKFLTDLHNKSNNLKSLQIKSLELREKQKALISSISQRLKWAAGANPDLCEINSAFEASLRARDEKLEIDTRISDLTVQTCAIILKHEILRSNSAEAKGYDQLFLNSYQKWIHAFQFSNIKKIENVTQVEENIMRMYTEDLVNNPKWIKIIAEKISDVIKTTQKESSDCKQTLEVDKNVILGAISDFKSTYVEHCRIMQEFKNLIKSLCKISETSIKSQEFIANYRDYIERFTNLIHRFKKDCCNLIDVETSLRDLDYLAENTEDLYAGLLELEGKRFLGGGDRRRLVRQDGMSSSPVRLRGLKQESMTRGQQRNAYAVNVWRRIRAKLEGRDPDPGRRYTTQEQVDYVIREATSLDNLCLLYEGWTPWV